MAVLAPVHCVLHNDSIHAPRRRTWHRPDVSGRRPCARHGSNICTMEEAPKSLNANALPLQRPKLQSSTACVHVQSHREGQILSGAHLSLHMTLRTDPPMDPRPPLAPQCSPGVRMPAVHETADATALILGTESLLGRNQRGTKSYKRWTRHNLVGSEREEH
ncbi:hypothetical protein BC834DRAFT_237669 [Gloeopeniophorella convolvens]|nr:hypothetical protein BC834DRAFT_237669 [Gloeopeniophorella convolvens]